MIPKIIHIVWVGDEKLCPIDFINTWKKHNPDWLIKIWGNKEYNEYSWQNKSALSSMWDHEKCGVADIMRYEILYNIGGFTIDADSICLRPLDEWLFNVEAFVTWENELRSPELLSVGYMASVPKNPFFKSIIDDIKNDSNITSNHAWIKTGPIRLTDNWKKEGYNNLTIWPSHFFIPTHHTGTKYTGPGNVYCEQKWASTFDSYDNLKIDSNK